MHKHKYAIVKKVRKAKGLIGILPKNESRNWQNASKTVGFREK